MTFAGSVTEVEGGTLADSVMTLECDDGAPAQGGDADTCESVCKCMNSDFMDLSMVYVPIFAPLQGPQYQVPSLDNHL